jgi:hypothetical protein
MAHPGDVDLVLKGETKTEVWSPQELEAFACHDADLYEYVFTALVNRGYIMSPYWNILGSVSPYISETECGEFLEAFEEIVKTIG